MQSLADALAACGAVKFGRFRLTSGAESPYYVDVKQAVTDPTVLSAIAADAVRVAEQAGTTDRAAPPSKADVAATGATDHRTRFEAVAGMELGAVPIATAVSLAARLPMLIVRKAGRSHGTGKRIEGRDPKGLLVLVVEDVTTSGASTLEAVRVLREAGATVTHAIVVVDRESGAEALLAKHGVRLHALVKASELLKRPEAQAALAGAAKAEAGA